MTASVIPFATHTPSLAVALTDQAAEMLRRTSRSLVQVHNEPRGGGAGIIWSADGLVITNHHVVAGDSGHIHVLFPDGEALPARVLALHPEVDLAILKIDARNLMAALVADSHDLHIGQLVFAIGHPWGQPGVITAGIISALPVAVTQSGSRVPIIRSDALLAPGNSGGPLVNAAGGVIGINTMIVGGDQAVSLPSHLAQGLIEQAR